MTNYLLFKLQYVIRILTLAIVTRIETDIDQRTTVCPDSREHETSLGFSVALAATRHDKSPEEMAASIPHAINML